MTRQRARPGRASVKDEGNSAELELAKYMVNRTADAGVHGFAQRMIDDHSTAAVKLEAD